MGELEWHSLDACWAQTIIVRTYFSFKKHLCKLFNFMQCFLPAQFSVKWLGVCKVISLEKASFDCTVTG